MGPLTKKKLTQFIVDHFGCTKSTADNFLVKMDSFEYPIEEGAHTSDKFDDTSILNSEPSEPSEYTHDELHPSQDAEGNDLDDNGHKMDGN